MEQFVPGPHPTTTVSKNFSAFEGIDYGTEVEGYALLVSDILFSGPVSH